MLQVFNVDKLLHVDMVLQVLNVDMVDRGLCFTATNIDCSLDMELQSDTTGVESDQVTFIFDRFINFEFKKWVKTLSDTTG